MRPVSDVQSPGHRLQVCQRDDLGTLEGGNRDGTPRSFSPSISEQPGQAVGSITLAGPPDRGLVALHLDGDGLGPLAVGDRQDDPRPLHLEPGRALTVSQVEEDGVIMGPDRQGIRSSTAHGRRTPGNQGGSLPDYQQSEFLAGFVSEDTRAIALSNWLVAETCADQTTSDWHSSRRKSIAK